MTRCNKSHKCLYSCGGHRFFGVDRVLMMDDSTPSELSVESSCASESGGIRSPFKFESSGLSESTLCGGEDDEIVVPFRKRRRRGE